MPHEIHPADLVLLLLTLIAAAEELTASIIRELVKLPDDRRTCTTCSNRTWSSRECYRDVGYGVKFWTKR